MPRAYSAHNSYYDWGHPPDTATVVLAVGWARNGPDQWFAGCTLRTRIDNGLGVCEGPRQPWPSLWLRMRQVD